MTASGVLSSWETLERKSVRSVSTPESSRVIRLMPAMTSFSSPPEQPDSIGAMRTEKSPS